MKLLDYLKTETIPEKISFHAEIKITTLLDFLIAIFLGIILTIFLYFLINKITNYFQIFQRNNEIISIKPPSSQIYNNTINKQQQQQQQIRRGGGGLNGYFPIQDISDHGLYNDNLLNNSRYDSNQPQLNYNQQSRSNNHQGSYYPSHYLQMSTLSHNHNKNNNNHNNNNNNNHNGHYGEHSYNLDLASDIENPTFDYVSKFTSPKKHQELSISSSSHHSNNDINPITTTTTISSLNTSNSSSPPQFSDSNISPRSHVPPQFSNSPTTSRPPGWTFRLM